MGTVGSILQQANTKVIYSSPHEKYLDVSFGFRKPQKCSFFLVECVWNARSKMHSCPRRPNCIKWAEIAIPVQTVRKRPTITFRYEARAGLLIRVASERSRSDQKKKSQHIPPSDDPSKWIPEGILIWSTIRPAPRLVFLTRSWTIKRSLWAALEL